MNDSNFRILADAINHNAGLLEKHLGEGVYVHKQETPSTSWAIWHHLDSRRPLIETYDTNGNQIGHGVNRGTQTFDYSEVVFAIPMAGVAIVRY